MCGFSESADICIILDKNGNIFGQILRNSRKCVKNLSYRTFYLITKMPWFSAKRSLESFLTGEPNTNKKNSHWASVYYTSSSSHRPTFDEKNKDVS